MKYDFNLVSVDKSDARVVGSNIHGYWIYRHLCVNYEVLINDKKFNLSYSNGSFKFNVYSCHSNELDFDTVDSSELFILVNKLSNKLYNNESVINSDDDDCVELQELLRDLNLNLSDDDLFNLYSAIQDNRPYYTDYMDNEDDFVVKNIDRRCGSLEVTMSHDVKVIIDDCDDVVEILDKLEDIGEGYCDNFNHEYFRFFKYMFNRYDNENIILSFFYNVIL